MRSLLRSIPLLFVVLALLGCERPGESPRATAEAFLDAHYVRIDLESSREWTSGLARSKVDKEIELTADVRIDAETLKPRINYSLKNERAAESLVQYAYELTIRPQGMEPFTRLVTLTVRDEDGRWFVTNYNDTPTP